ncbi:MAG: sigma-54-dependent Fis family transcriptional regulator [Planctomycetaceae bacterium]|nr:sigma-54-dependent Fis family transcriptional regulator [Planctomycetales bacterium]MCB9874103.1 sigma-54-dependent Fis family transcriptional regulator [Planctomycetaceae bacterium]MCB9940556.1 sigma-54-dependent Fis family transcriptional regulator [Planctomycetaceae bacterium]HRX78792.1 sigma-54 dependent transcriptional regulator [Pirellulaceae bacterium]
MNNGSLLLVDDDRHVLDSMSDWLREQGYEVAEASGRADAIRQVDNRTFDLVLADVRLQDGDGFDVLAHCRKNHPETTVILLTGYGTVETGVEAIRAGAFDLLTKPLIDEELLMSINRALSQRQVIEENRKLKEQLDLRFGMENIVGHDHRMLKIYDMIDSIANTKATVLITGESGTGKSLIARAIHRRSSRRENAFVEIACGALPEALLESELFGHVAGAFTGAVGEKMGKFLQADRGTIFLDEIGTASPSMQVKLLRVLQDFEFEQVGGTKTFHVDSRVVLATNEELSRAVAEGRFRQDLFYRVNVINIELPSLRERISDIPLLAQHFLASVCEESGRNVEGFTDDALSALRRYQWPGNVRELQNVVERAVLLGKGSMITVADLPSQLSSGAPVVVQPSSGVSLKNALDAPERQIILDALQSNNWNRNATAELLGINRTTLYKKMKKLGLQDPRQSMTFVQQ